MQTHRSLPPLLAPLVPGPLAALGVATAPAAQAGASGSVSLRSTARQLETTGASQASTGYAIESQVGYPTTGPTLTSASYQFRGSAVWTGNDFAPPGPVVFGITNDIGPPGAVGTNAGGETETVVGVGFQAPGAVTAKLGALDATNVTVVSDSEPTLVRPPGVNFACNALTGVELSVTTSLGTYSTLNAYHYLRELVACEEPRIDDTWRLTYLGDVGSWALLLYGIPGPPVPFSFFSGAAELDIFSFSVAGFLNSTTGPGVHVFPLPIPDSPSLVGKPLEWQALSWDLTLTPVGFTNRLTSTFAPASDCD